MAQKTLEMDDAVKMRRVRDEQLDRGFGSPRLSFSPQLAAKVRGFLNSPGVLGQFRRSDGSVDLDKMRAMIVLSALRADERARGKLMSEDQRADAAKYLLRYEKTHAPFSTRMLPRSERGSYLAMAGEKAPESGTLSPELLTPRRMPPRNDLEAAIEAAVKGEGRPVARKRAKAPEPETKGPSRRTFQPGITTEEELRKFYTSILRYPDQVASAVKLHMELESSLQREARSSAYDGNYTKDIRFKVARDATLSAVRERNQAGPGARVSANAAKIAPSNRVREEPAEEEAPPAEPVARRQTKGQPSIVRYNPATSGLHGRAEFGPAKAVAYEARVFDLEGKQVGKAVKVNLTSAEASRGLVERSDEQLASLGFTPAQLKALRAKPADMDPMQGLTAEPRIDLRRAQAKR